MSEIQLCQEDEESVDEIHLVEVLDVYPDKFLPCDKSFEILIQAAFRKRLVSLEWHHLKIALWRGLRVPREVPRLQRIKDEAELSEDDDDFVNC